MDDRDPDEPPQTAPDRPAGLEDDALERAALDYLARYAASRRGVERVLTRRIEKRGRLGAGETGDARAALTRVLDRLAAQGLLDDRRFAEARARSLMARGRSTAAIRAALRDKGVDPARADEAVAGLAEETPSPDLCAAVALARRRRLGPFRPQDARGIWRDRDLATMARAGFPRDVACRVVDARDPEALRGAMGDAV
jgi:regulatory protein